MNLDMTREGTRRHGRPKGSKWALAMGLSISTLMAASLVGWASPAIASADVEGSFHMSASFVGPFHKVDQVASTVPANGDVNPYGVVVVPRTKGNLVQGDVLVSNFNNSKNLQGTGTTIVEVSPSGKAQVFAQIPPSTFPVGVGLTTALSVLPGGWVVVGSVSTADGTAATIKSGGLIVLNDHGHVVETITNPLINGPWDMTAVPRDDGVVLFVSNVLNGITPAAAANNTVVDQGTVVRLRLHLPDDSDSDSPPRVTSAAVVAKGFPEQTSGSALIIGPTGVGVGFDGTLYVADTLGNRIAAVPDALHRSEPTTLGRTVLAGSPLNQPLGLAIAPGGDILTVNAQDGNLVEVNPFFARAVATRTVEPQGAGTLFGLAPADHRGVYLADDGTNALDILH